MRSVPPDRGASAEDAPATAAPPVTGRVVIASGAVEAGCGKAVNFSAFSRAAAVLAASSSLIFLSPERHAAAQIASGNRATHAGPHAEERRPPLSCSPKTHVLFRVPTPNRWRGEVFMKRLRSVYHLTVPLALALLVP